MTTTAFADYFDDCPAARLARHVARFARVATASGDGMARYYAASAREHLDANRYNAAFLAVESGIGALRAFHPKYRREHTRKLWSMWDDASVPPTRDMLPPAASSDRTRRRHADAAVREAGGSGRNGEPAPSFRWGR